MMKNAIGLLSLLLLGTTVSIQAAPFANGGFDDISINNFYENITTNSSKLSPWKITGGNIDIVANSYWKAHGGLNTIDLLGDKTTFGQIEQSFDTISGKKYTVSFKMSAHPEDERDIMKVLNVMVNNSNMNNSLKYTYDPNKNGNSFNDMKWQNYSFDFIAKSNSATLIFTGSNANGTISNFGPVIDSVTITPNDNPEICCTCSPCNQQN